MSNLVLSDIEFNRRAAQKATTVLSALANENRLAILCQLASGERTVGELQKAVGISQSALSQHLARLRDDQLAKTRRSGTTIYYTLNGSDVSRIIQLLYTLYCRPGRKRS